MRKPGKATIILFVMAFVFNCSSSTSSNPTLADIITGKFVGILQNPSGIYTDYAIIISEIDDAKVQIAPESGDVSATFEADLESEDEGDVTTIILKSAEDTVENNGTFLEPTGRLSYVLHLGGNEEGNVEVFVGEKQ